MTENVAETGSAMPFVTLLSERSAVARIWIGPCTLPDWNDAVATPWIVCVATDAPVIPVAHWGAQRILGYRSKRVHLFPRKLVQAAAGAPVDLSKYRALEPTNDVLREVTDLLMTRVKELLGELRGETPPPGFYMAGSASETPHTASETPHTVETGPAGTGVA